MKYLQRGQQRQTLGGRRALGVDGKKGSGGIPNQEGRIKRQSGNEK